MSDDDKGPSLDVETMRYMVTMESFIASVLRMAHEDDLAVYSGRILKCCNDHGLMDKFPIAWLKPRDSILNTDEHKNRETHEQGNQTGKK